MTFPIATAVGLALASSLTLAYVAFKLGVPERLDPTLSKPGTLSPPQDSEKDRFLLGMMVLSGTIVYLVDVTVAYGLVGKYMPENADTYSLASFGLHAAMMFPIIYWAGRTKGDLRTLGISPGIMDKFSIGLLLSFICGVGVRLLRGLLLGKTITIAQDFAPVSVLVVYLTIAPISEEIFFRGYFQGAFLGSSQLSISVTSLMFVMIHIPKAIYYSDYALNPFSLVPPNPVFSPLLYLAILFGFSWASGLIYRRTGSLLLPILLHMAFNLSAVLTV